MLSLTQPKRNSIKFDMNIHFLISENAPFLSHGNMYSNRIAEGLKANGHQVSIYSLPEDFPFFSEQSLLQCKQIAEMIPGQNQLSSIIQSLGLSPKFCKTCT